MKNKDKFRGCLIGGAAGDALGYAVEFVGEKYIFSKYGKKGITEYELTKGVAQFSDDTQMTMFTADGLLLAKEHLTGKDVMEQYISGIAACYKDWLKTQDGTWPVKKESCVSRLMDVRELFSPRAPGMACMSSIRKGAYGRVRTPINDSKGCGGVMRVAPVGLFFDGEGSFGRDEIDWLGAEAAAITHGHDLGYIPAAALVHIVQKGAHDDSVTLLEAVEEAMEAVKRLFADAVHLDVFLKLTEKAIQLSQTDMKDLDCIHQLGEGWVAEETFAIAVYCALKYTDDFDKALIASVNHKGDSDSTGAVTGNILGAYLGFDRIPEKYIQHLELKETILKLADELYQNG